MTDLPSLIERVEKASGPDRELDDLVDSARLGWELDTAGSSKIALVSKPYTASLDAAMSLTDGEQWSVEHYPGCTHPSGNSAAWVGSPTKRHTGNSPALALIAAALRARKDR